jgi:hypothetical protein
MLHGGSSMTKSQLCSSRRKAFKYRMDEREFLRKLAS